MFRLRQKFVCEIKLFNGQNNKYVYANRMRIFLGIDSISEVARQSHVSVSFISECACVGGAGLARWTLYIRGRIESGLRRPRVHRSTLRVAVIKPLSEPSLPPAFTNYQISIPCKNIRTLRCHLFDHAFAPAGVDGHAMQLCTECTS